MTVVINNFPEDIYKRLCQSAKKHKCSVNDEIVSVLANSLGDDRIDSHLSSKALWASLQTLRDETGVYVIEKEQSPLKKMSRKKQV